MPSFWRILVINFRFVLQKEKTRMNKDDNQAMLPWNTSFRNISNWISSPTNYLESLAATSASVVVQIGIFVWNFLISSSPLPLIMSRPQLIGTELLVEWHSNVVSCPTRWFLWYWSLDFYVDHLVGGCDPLNRRLDYSGQSWAPKWPFQTVSFAECIFYMDGKGPKILFVFSAPKSFFFQPL